MADLIEPVHMIPARTLLCLKMRGGTSAFSCLYVSTAIKATNKTPPILRER
jgi:hypothetical protein